MEHIVRYTPQQNGVYERNYHILKEMTNCMIQSKGPSLNYWGKVINYVIQLFSARNESGDIIKKCTEISRISNNIIEMYQRCNHKHRDTIIHNFLLMSENVQRL
jgi:hypothetical protein